MNYESRANGMLALYKQGHTLQSIGEHYGLTRERVRQILTRTFNVRGDGGGAHVKGELKRAAYLAQRDRRYQQRYGCTHEEWKRLSLAKVCIAYKYMRRTAGTRGIEFRLTLADFWALWEQSGKWSERGRGRGRYCMSRINDAGAYEVGNVVILTNEDNVRLYAISKKGHAMRPKHLQGVCKLFPGWKKPFVAYHRRVRIGYFATEAEAYAARAAHIASLAATA
jgi:hypothetical protein